MQESPFVELIMQRGIDQGALQNCIKNILTILTERFPKSDTAHVADILESIQDLDKYQSSYVKLSKHPALIHFYKK